MSRIRSLAKDWVPPVLLRALSFGPRVTFAGDFGSWSEAAARSTGYDSQLILERVLAATLKVKNGEAAFERDSVVFNKIEYVWPVTAALMWAAARHDGELNVLDFGGSLGTTYFQNRALLEPLRAVRWGIVEQPAFVEAGRKYVQDERLRFYSSIPACLADGKPNIVLLSSAIQYLDEPYPVLRSLAAAGASVIVLDRTPISEDDRERIVIQQVHPLIYPASYPMRILSMASVLAALGPAYRMVASFTAPEGKVQADSCQFSFMGMILHSASDATP